jgi:hypothetical protein
LGDVVERLERDGEFAVAVRQDPRGALAGYELDADELNRLAELVAERPHHHLADLFGAAGAEDDNPSLE